MRGFRGTSGQIVIHIHYLIQDLGFNIEGIRRMQALVPCWDLLPCHEESRRDCPAYRNTTRPCWAINGMACAPKGNECRRCHVYRLGSINEFEDLDVFEMAAEGVLVIEWGDAVEAALPADHLRVEFEVEDDETRVLRLVPHGDWNERDLRAVT